MTRHVRPFICLLLTLVGLLLAQPGAAQDVADAAEDTADASLRPWDVNLTGRFTATQAAYDNWQEGGINTLALTADLLGDAATETASWIHTHELRMTYGFIRQDDTLGVRKADDVLYLASSLQHKGRGFFQKFRPTVSLNLRTQFAPGYSYTEVPPKLQGTVPVELPVKVSDFFAPATFTQTLGLTYQPEDWFTQRLSVAGKQTVVALERLRPLYGLAPDDAVRFEVGLEARSEVNKEVFENVLVKSGLSLFAAFHNPDVPDMRWDNLITMKVNSWLGVNLEFVTLYDRDVSSELQMKEVLSLGVTVVAL